MELNNRQKKVVEATEPYILCLASAASGKALPNSTIIPTLCGPKSVGDIKIGDYLFDRNGKPTQVLGVYPQGELEVYELTLGDGRKAKCSKEHIWSVNKTTWKDRNSFREMTVEEILNSSLINSSRGANFYIPCSQAVEYPEKEYKIHPYIIGAFLGDGCCKEHQLTISSEDDVIPSHIADLLGNAQIKRQHENNYSWNFSNANGKIYTDILPKELVCYSYEKRIPYEYKYGSIEQRYELIRGLMDTDGSISKDQRIDHAATATVRFTSTSYELIKDMQEVLGSLGYISKIKKDERTNKYTKNIRYDLAINIDNVEKEKLFWLPRKKDIALSVKDKKQQRRYDRTSIRSIVSLNYKEEMTCFYVDNEEHLFLMNDFIVTHNTRTLTERIKYLIEVRKVKPSDIVAISFTNMAADEIKRRIGDCCKGAYIGTVHGYANQICLANCIDTSSWISTFNFDEIIKRAIKIQTQKYPKVKHILVDECQDLSALEYNFLERIPAENRFYTGDNRQNIYQFKGCTDEYLVAMYYDNKYAKYFLTENYRNAPNIIEFAESYIYNANPIGPPAQAVKTKDGNIEQCIFTEALEELEWSGNWGSWFILTRTNNELVEAQDMLNERGIPNVTFKKGDLDILQLDALVASNKVKILTIHTAKGLENKNVIVTGARTYNEEERKICYVAATRAENNLYWCPAIAKRYKKGQGLKRRAEAGRIFDKSGESIIF